MRLTVVADREEPPSLTRIQSWIAEIVCESDILPAEGSGEPLDLGSLEASLRLPAPPNFPDGSGRGQAA